LPSRAPVPVSRASSFPEAMRAVGNAPWKNDRSGFAPAPNPAFRRNRPHPKMVLLPRTGCPEAKDSQPFGRFASSPPSKAAEHPSVTDLLPRTPGVRPSRLAWPVAPSCLGGEGPRLASQAGLGLHSTALPRRRTVCAETRVLSTDRPERVQGSPPLRARSVSPSRRPRGALRIVRPTPFVLRPSASP